jgi:sarcosine oxidase subunit gamma
VRIETRLGASLPATCGAVTIGDGVSMLWLSPDEFLVVSDRQPAELTASLVAALEGEPGSATDLSANRTTFELSGPSARAVLEKGCPLDLHPRAFDVGSAYVTLIGSVPVILWKVADESYEILPRSSFADFLGRWLLDAMAEFKAPAWR